MRTACVKNVAIKAGVVRGDEFCVLEMSFEQRPYLLKRRLILDVFPFNAVQVSEFKFLPGWPDELIKAVGYFAVFNGYNGHGAGAVAAPVGRQNQCSQNVLEISVSCVHIL